MADLFSRETKKMDLTKNQKAASQEKMDNRCAICKKPNAGFGFGVSLLHNRLGLWSCFEHRSDVEKMTEGKS